MSSISLSWIRQGLSGLIAISHKSLIMDIAVQLLHELRSTQLSVYLQKYQSHLSPQERKKGFGPRFRTE